MFRWVMRFLGTRDDVSDRKMELRPKYCALIPTPTLLFFLPIDDRMKIRAKQSQEQQKRRPSKRKGCRIGHLLVMSKTNMK